jgi:hypothetical protein
LYEIHEKFGTENPRGNLYGIKEKFGIENPRFVFWVYPTLLSAVEEGENFIFFMMHEDNFGDKKQ